ncbi:MAG: hypothetical protein C4326_01690 [Ignavibacteria bacterium]
MSGRVVAVVTMTIVVLVCPAMQAQDASAKFRLAQSYEQGGDFENALTLYRELYAREPSNYMYFDGLRRSLLQLKRYDEAAGLIRHRLGMYPNDANLFCLLGGALYQAGNEREADAAWEKAIATEPTNPNAYRLVANSLLEHRLLDKGAAVFKRARIACNDPTLFTLDLAQLLAVSMDYAGATTEFLRYLEQAPMQLLYVQNRMAQFTAKEEARNEAILVVREALRKSNDMNLYRLLGWLLQEGKRYEEAFGVYKTIDRMANARGAELYAFAERAYKEGAFAIAAEAYKAAIEAPLSPQRLPYAKYGYALALKELSVQSDTASTQAGIEGPLPESQARSASAIERFRAIINEYPHTEFAARSAFQIGMIQYSRYFDLDAALASFTIVQQSSVPALQYDAAIKIGEVLTAKGDTTGAMQWFRTVIAAPNATPDQQDEATYRLAEVQYFNGNFSEALKTLEAVSTNLKADYANDALLLLAFLQENTLTAPAPLKEFARADFLARQKKYTEAITALQFLIEKYPQVLFVDDALLRIASLQTLAARYNDALLTYQRLLSQFKESSIALDKAQFSIAEVYDYRLKDKAQALAAYERLLADYPQSLYGERARKRIRELRGDSL